MEFNPSLTPTYLAGKIDEYVKFQGRDTVKLNASRDRNARFARIPDGKACDFCKMLGSRGFVYHSEAKAGGDGQYHPYCNCQIAVSFEPFIERRLVGSTRVTRGYGLEDAVVTVPGRDGSDVLRPVDIDELYEEYKAMGRNFDKKAKYKDYTAGARLSDKEFEAAMKRLEDSKTLDELHDVGKDIVNHWPKNANGRDAAQWDEMSRRAKELEWEFKTAVKKRDDIPVFGGASSDYYFARFMDIDGSLVDLKVNTKITDVEEFAGAGYPRKIDEVDKLIKRHGGTKDDWVKVKGKGKVELDGVIVDVELHWYEMIDNPVPYDRKIVKYLL